jgi:hypothetical protein
MSEHAYLTIGKYHRVRVAHPDGTNVTIVYDASIPVTKAHDSEYARRAWSQKNPTWNLDAVNAWTSQATVTEERSWETRWYDASGGRSVDANLTNWRDGFPAEGIIALLDSYATEGWEVLHVSEDKGVYRGADALDEAYPARVRYLLRRK